MKKTLTEFLEGLGIIQWFGNPTKKLVYAVSDYLDLTRGADLQHCDRMIAAVERDLKSKVDSLEKKFSGATLDAPITSILRRVDALKEAVDEVKVELLNHDVRRNVLYKRVDSTVDDISDLRKRLKELEKKFRSDTLNARETAKVAAELEDLRESERAPPKLDDLVHGSCLEKREPGEPAFVLLGRDIAAACGIEAWAHWRMMLSKNTAGDDQIKAALEVANKMRAYYHERKVR